MIRRVKEILFKYRELIMYGIFGVGATLINILVYYLFADIIRINYMAANALAWVSAFLFAFVTNKLLVFESKSWKGMTALKEMVNFFFVRLGTGILDMVLMYVFIDLFQWNGVVSKVIVNFIVIIINYIASKFWIFTKKETTHGRQEN